MVEEVLEQLPDQSGRSRVLTLRVLAKVDLLEHEIAQRVEGAEHPFGQPHLRLIPALIDEVVHERVDPPGEHLVEHLRLQRRHPQPADLFVDHADGVARAALLGEPRQDPPLHLGHVLAEYDTDPAGEIQAGMLAATSVTFSGVEDFDLNGSDNDDTYTPAGP